MEALTAAHYNNKDYKGCIDLAGQLIERAGANGDVWVRAEGLRLLSRSYIRTARYDDAKHALQRLRDQEGKLTPGEYRDLCLVYLKTGALDSAGAYRKLAASDGQKSLWVVIKDSQTGKLFSDMLDLQEPVTTDSTVQKIVNQNLAQTVAGYHACEEALQEAELHNERLSKIVIATVLLLVIAFLSLWYYLHLTAHRREMELKMLEAENICHILPSPT